MNYKESAEFERACATRAVITPRWLPGTSTFWYRQALPSDKYDFIFVDCEKGTRRPAFDHEDLASKLSNSIDGEILDPHKLPLNWLNIDLNGLWVRFQYLEKTWQFSKAGKLEEYYGEFITGGLEMDRNTSKPSPKKSPGKSQITIANLTASTLGYYWIDYDGNDERRINQVLPGESFPFLSPIGHRFRFWEASTGRVVVLELKHKQGIANIEDTSEGLAVSWEDDPFDEPDEAPESKDETACDINQAIETKYEPIIRQYNLWVRNDGNETQISFNGFEDDYYQYLCTTPDKKYVVVIQTRAGSKYPLDLKNSVPKEQFRPKVFNHNPTSRGWRRAGDHLDIDRPRLFDLECQREIPTNDSLFRNPYQIQRIGWSIRGTKYRFIFNERGHQHIRLLEIAIDGSTKVLVEDSSDTVVDYNQKFWYRLLPKSNEIIWASERDGWNHLYRFDLQDGSLKNQITKGEWVVKSVEHVDIKEQKIWFTAYGVIAGQDPYYAHLASVNFDGSEFRVITTEDGTHIWRFSPNRRFIIDSWSRVDLLPQVAVVEVSTSKKVVCLHGEDVKEDYLLPERFTAKGRDDATDIYGVIFRPYDFNPTKKYAIIEFIYAHPFQFYTPKKFRNFSSYRKIADSGFIVVVVDGMGTNWRSKDFQDVAYKNINDAGFPDRIKWMQAAAKTRPWMDVTRVGIQGGSAGGQNAASAVLHHSDFYKAAIAESGSHDLRMSDYKWAEMFMGWPIDASYEKNSNCANAAKLNGALMLVTGEVDNVVDPAATMRFASALIKADKDFDMVIVPNGDHFTTNSDWLDKKRVQFFKRHIN